MEIKCKRDELLKALNVVSRAISPRTPMEILKGIHLSVEDNTLSLTATDMSAISIRKKIDVEAKETGQTVIPAKLFIDIVKKLPSDEVSMVSKESRVLTIKSGSVKFEITGFLAEEFPSITQAENPIGEVQISKDTFKDMIDRTAFAASTDETRGALTGILTEISDNTLRMVAVDGFKMAIVNETTETENTSCQFLIDARVMTELAKITVDEADAEVVNIVLDDKAAHVSIADTYAYVRRFQTDFVKYETLLPKESTTKITVDRDALYQGLERASLFAKEGRNNLVKVNINDGGLIITSRAEEGNTREAIFAEKDGNDILIGFNAKYLMDTLKAIPDSEITLNLTNEVSPCLVKPLEGEGYQYLVLPVRISGRD